MKVRVDDNGSPMSIKYKFESDNMMYYVFAWCQAFRLGFVGSSSGFKFNNLDFSGWWVLPFLNSGYIYFTAKCCFNLQWFCFGYKIMYVNPGLVWGLQRSCAERKWRWCSQPPTLLQPAHEHWSPETGMKLTPHRPSDIWLHTFRTLLLIQHCCVNEKPTCVLIG